MIDPLGSNHRVLSQVTFGHELLDRTRRNPSPNFCCPFVLPRNRRLRKGKFIEQNTAVYVIYVMIALFVYKAFKVPTTKLESVTIAGMLPSSPPS